MTKEKIIKALKWFFFSYIWLALVMLAIDIITKLCIVNAVHAVEGTVLCEIIPGFLNIEYVANKAAAFGLGFDDYPLINRILYICVAIIGSGIIIGLTIYKNVTKKPMKPFVNAMLMLILSGAIGNLLDRLFYSVSGYCVIDWINFYGIWGYHFNIADSCIVVGCIAFIVYLIVEEVKEYRAKKALEPNDDTKVLSIDEQRRKDEIEASKNSK